MKNFIPRCVAALAGNGAVLISIGSYVAGNTDARVLWEQAPFLGGVFLFALIGVVCAYSALEHEELTPSRAVQRLKWSARIFFISMFGFAAALITVGVR